MSPKQKVCLVPNQPENGKLKFIFASVIKGNQLEAKRQRNKPSKTSLLLQTSASEGINLIKLFSLNYTQRIKKKIPIDLEPNGNPFGSKH